MHTKVSSAIFAGTTTLFLCPPLCSLASCVPSGKSLPRKKELASAYNSVLYVQRDGEFELELRFDQKRFSVTCIEGDSLYRNPLSTLVLLSKQTIFALVSSRVPD